MPKRIEPRGVNKACAATLVAAREASGLSLRALADKTGLHHLRVMRSLNCEQPMTVDDLVAIARALGLTGWRVLCDAQTEADAPPTRQEIRQAIEEIPAPPVRLYPPTAAELGGEVESMPVTRSDPDTVDQAARREGE